jgi:hypothetical protein
MCILYDLGWEERYDKNEKKYYYINKVLLFLFFEMSMTNL